MVHPAKRDLKRTRIEREMLNFRPGPEPALPAHARLDGIDRDFLFGNARSHGGCIPSPSRLGTLQASGALALAHTNFFQLESLMWSS